MNKVEKVYKIVAVGKTSMFSCNISFVASIDIINGREVDDSGLVIPYKMGQITYPDERAIFKKLFAFRNFQEAQVCVDMYRQCSYADIRIVIGYAGNPLLINSDSEEEQKYTHEGLISYGVSPQYILCDWFIPVKVAKTYKATYECVNGVVNKKVKVANKKVKVAKI